MGMLHLYPAITHMTLLTCIYTKTICFMTNLTLISNKKKNQMQLSKKYLYGGMLCGAVGLTTGFVFTTVQVWCQTRDQVQINSIMTFIITAQGDPLLFNDQLLPFLHHLCPKLLCSQVEIKDVIQQTADWAGTPSLISSFDHVKDMISDSWVLSCTTHNSQRMRLYFPHTPVSAVHLNRGGRKWREKPPGISVSCVACEPQFKRSSDSFARARALIQGRALRKQTKKVMGVTINYSPFIRSVMRCHL